MIKSIASFAATVALTTSVLAQALEEPVGYTGAIVAVADESVTLRATDGKVTEVTMTRGWHVAVIRPVAADAIQVGSFIGAANLSIDERTGTAVEFRIFEPGNKPEEGTHAMGGKPTLMTHGTVINVKATVAGREVEVAYPGGGRKIIVPPDVQVRQSFVIEQSRAQTGTMVTAVTRKGTDGVWRATRLLLSAPAAP